MFKSKGKTPRSRFVHLITVSLPKRMPLRFLKWGSKMPSSKYDLVDNDEFDTRIPLHPDEAFHYGITFHAKYIGTMDVPRPTSRVEIVAAMRRVRYEFKAKGVKKRKVTVDVSIDGVRVTTRKKISKSNGEGSRLFGLGSSNKSTVELMHHPIYRIFYVSHDSSDLKIFSYIARDGATNAFKCNVFKSNKKCQAMRIVRTVGQAFEVCHKLSINQEPEASTSSAIDEAAFSDKVSEVAASKEGGSEVGTASGSGVSTRPVETKKTAEETKPQQLTALPPPPKTDRKRSPNIPEAPLINFDIPECVTKVDIPPVDCTVSGSNASLSAQHQVKLLRERLEQQAQQTRAAVAQLLLLRDQLAAEQAARCEAQARTHQLLVHNKELLEHIAALVSHLQDRESGSPCVQPISAKHLTLLPQTLAAASEMKDILKSDQLNANQPMDNETFFKLISSSNKTIQNINNNNTNISFDDLTNEQIQDFLIGKFQSLDVKSEPNCKPNKNPHFYQNRNAFPHIAPLDNDFDIETLDAKPGQNNNGLSPDDITKFSFSTTETSKDSSPDLSSSDEGVSFIMPLSHNATLKATGEDGRVRLIVPVSPSNSVSDVVQIHAPPQDHSGHTLRVPDNDRSATQQGTITRTTSEKVPNRSEMMTAMRSQWTRHTTK